MYPSFRTFAEFIHSLAVIMNDTSFKFQPTESGNNRKDPEKQNFSNINPINRKALNRQVLNTNKTTVENKNSNDLKSFQSNYRSRASRIHASILLVKNCSTWSSYYRVHTRIFGCTTQLKCPSLIECNEILISKQEIATPAIARHYKHLHDIEQFIPELDRNAEVMLLIGRDATAAHHILDQRIDKDNKPYAQRLRLGWAIIGETCLGLVHTLDTITVNKTTVLPNGRETNLKPCEYGFRVKDREPDIGSTVFKQTREDDTLGLSQEDKEFLIVMDKEFHKSGNGRLSAPLHDTSVANYGLRKAVCNHTDLDTCDDVCHYVNNNFDVDDGLVSGDSPEEIVSLIKRTQERLITGGKIRLHKIVSNNSEVVKSFETKDLAESITEIDFNSESTCLQRSLGLCWNVVKDSFTYQLSKEEKPFTKRGLLSVINGIFDPLGFIAPVILGGRLIMREAVQNSSLDWDDPLPNNLLSDWQRWKQSLQDLETLEIGRPFTSQSLNE
ncbi:Hypothetical predicted protein [Mytilus galloprovincialis]|uniref:Uncharacterized protein n=1 Tax=Mytilus galloprovincialis TaxID=29158 RepID=A0A8B6C2C0_MYTGA|nr:Hypothetical predicted protein [Mytilus galloprovincialis]